MPTTNIACREVGTSDIEATTFSLFLSRQDRQVQERNNDYSCHNVQSIGTWIYSSLLLEAFRNSVSHMCTVLQEFTYYSRPLLDSISSQSRPCKTRRRVGWKNPQTRCRSQTSLLCSEPLPTLIETFLASTIVVIFASSLENQKTKESKKNKKTGTYRKQKISQ